MKFAEADRQINNLRIEAKRFHRITEAELANKCGCSASTLSHRASAQELPFLTFWVVAKLAEAAGYRIKFERG